MLAPRGANRDRRSLEAMSGAIRDSTLTADSLNLPRGGWRRARRSPYHQAGGNQKLALLFRIGRLLGLLAKSLKGGSRQVGARKPDGGERRQREFGEVDIVEAD